MRKKFGYKILFEIFLTKIQILIKTQKKENDKK